MKFIKTRHDSDLATIVFKGEKIVAEFIRQNDGNMVFESDDCEVCELLLGMDYTGEGAMPKAKPAPAPVDEDVDGDPEEDMPTDWEAMTKAEIAQMALEQFGELEGFEPVNSGQTKDEMLLEVEFYKEQASQPDSEADNEAGE